jgi:hypothetical protein
MHRIPYFRTVESGEEMTSEWKQAEKALNQIQIESKANNEPVTVSGHAEGLHCIGIGTDAAVFSYIHAPKYAFKVYTPEALPKKNIEKGVYARIGASSYFPACYGAGENYLALSFETGITLYDCLLQGVPIPNQVISDVDDAREYVRSVGLNPRDIHLKNVLLQKGRAKLLDVSEYIKPGNDQRWEYLKRGYDEFYPLIEGKQIPAWILETIKKWYNRMDAASFTVEEFGKRMTHLFFKDSN